MPTRITPASCLTLIFAVTLASPSVAAAQPSVADEAPPPDAAAQPAPVEEVPPTAAPPDASAPDTPRPTDAPTDAPTDVTAPTDAPADLPPSSTPPASAPDTPRTPPPTSAPDTPRTPPPTSAPDTPRSPPPPATDAPRTPPPTNAPDTPRSPPPPATDAPRTPPPPTSAPDTPASPGDGAGGASSSPPAGKRESVREANRRRDEADKRQRFRHGGFILDAKAGAGGCMRTHCYGSAGHHAAPGLHLGGFVGFNLFGLIELGVEGGWNALKPRDVAGRNALALYGLDPDQIQQAITADSSLPFPMLDFSSFNVTSAKSRAFDIGPSLRIHLIRKGRGLLFVGAGVHYQLWRNDYKTEGGDLRIDSHGASLPLRVGTGVFIVRNLALMLEVAYAPAIFGGMTFRRGSDRGVVPFKILEDTTGIDVSRGMPHFWTAALTLRFRL